MKNLLNKSLLPALLALAFLSSIVFAQTTTRYLYDNNGRLHAVLTPTGEANVYEYDPAGNFTAIKRLTINDLTVLDFSPQAGVPGDQVTLYGTGFGAGVSAVSFNGVAAKIVSSNAQFAVVEVPQGATTGTLALSTAKGTTTTSNAFTVRGIRVTPNKTTATSGNTIQFTATVILDGDQSVKWSVNGIEGGSDVVGTITNAGLYTAPFLAAATPASLILVRANSAANTTVYGEAQVTIKNSDFLRSAYARAVSVRFGKEATSTPATMTAMPISVRYGKEATTTPATLTAVPVSVRFGKAAITTPAIMTAMPVSIRYGTTAAVSGILASRGVSTMKGPTITAVSPTTATKGASVNLTISGVNLSGANALQFINSDGSIEANFSVTNITVNANGSSLTATLTVNNNAVAGRRFIVVVTPTLRSGGFDTGTNFITVP